MARTRKRILITAGPTREMLDPVRFISNRSTGEMGYELAKTAKAEGYQVTLISGPTALNPPKGVRFISVISAKDLQKACRQWFPKQDALIMTAAVCDFTVPSLSAHKIRRTARRKLILRQTPDILSGLAQKKGRRIVIGFCLETKDWIRNAKRKLRRKHLDGMVANYTSRSHVPFGKRRIHTAFVNSRGQVRHLRNVTKKQVSRSLLEWMGSLEDSR